MSHKKSFGELFDEITSESGIGTESVRAAFDGILAGEWTPVQIAGFVVALRSAGESATTIRAAAEAMRAAMIPSNTIFRSCSTPAVPEAMAREQ